MAILRSSDGRFYNVPDEDLEKFLVPADEVKTQLTQNPSELTGSDKAESEVKAHGTPWRNCWRNCFRKTE